MSIIQTEIDKYCALCENAEVLSGTEYVLCRKKGVVSAGYLCKKFCFDPLKRIPKPRPALPDVEGL